nr:choice-of-anchor E domain-containing protein [Mangrovicoccus sp. HB161399]
MFAGAPVSAFTVSYSDAFALSDVEISGTLSVPLFDSSLGTLTGVTWEITGAIASILGVQNDSSNPIVGSAHTTVDYDVDSALLSLGGSPDFSVFGTTGLVSLGVGASALFPVTATNTLSGSETPSSSFFLPGTLDVSFLTDTSFGGSGFGGDITISQATDAGISLSVTYEYETAAVPLPAGLALLMSALGITGLMHRRQG